MDFTIDSWMVAWNAKHTKPEVAGPLPAGAVKVGSWPDLTGWSDDYDMISGCCDRYRIPEDLHGKVMMMFIDFHTLVVAEGLDPQAVHMEFLKIDEYRRRIPANMVGAEGGDLFVSA